MSFNLLTESWLPFKYKDGSIKTALISQLSDPNIIDIELPRSDFYGAAYQLLIGLLQTAFTPEDMDEWERYFNTPPSAETLNAAFDKVKFAFNLTGEGPLFMQDLDPLSSVGISPVSALLIEAPGENTIKNNVDHFIKRDTVNGLSLGMAALALFTLQINAPSGGVGYRTGLRGGGPLTMILLPQKEESSLFEKLWLNIRDLEGIGEPLPRVFDGSVFPWLVETLDSKIKGAEILQKDKHPFYMYWAMPRRIRLHVEAKETRCDLSNLMIQEVVREYRTINYGNNYTGTWRHPLTHYRSDPKKNENDEWLSTKGRPGGIQYKQWYALTYKRDTEGNHIPLTLEDYYDRKNEGKVNEIRLWVFGFDMDNMKARSWYEHRFPVLAMDPGSQKRFMTSVIPILELTEEIVSQLIYQVKSAWYKSPKDASGDLSFIELSFWQQTESLFFNTLFKIAQEKDYTLTPEIAKKWRDSIRMKTFSLFDTYALSSLDVNANFKEKMNARHWLTCWLLGSKQIKEFNHNYKIEEEENQDE